MLISPALRQRIVRTTHRFSGRLFLVPPEPVGMPFGLIAAFNLVFVAFIYVGSVSRPTAKAKQRPGRDVLGTISSDAVIVCAMGCALCRWAQPRPPAPLAHGHCPAVLP